MNSNPNQKTTSWKPPHICKIYEALTAIADGRIKLVSPTKAKCYSSSRNKYYEIDFDTDLNKLMSNDNSAYYTGSLSYPMIATLMLRGKIKYSEKLLNTLRGIPWKNINSKFKNNYHEALDHVLQNLLSQGVDIIVLNTQINAIYKEIRSLKLRYLGKRRRPPNAY